MNAILTSSEIMDDLVSTALKIIWRKSGECTPRDLVAEGRSEGEVAKYGEAAITKAKAHYEGARAS